MTRVWQLIVLIGRLMLAGPAAEDWWLKGGDA